MDVAGANVCIYLNCTKTIHRHADPSNDMLAKKKLQA